MTRILTEFFFIILCFRLGVLLSFTEGNRLFNYCDNNSTKNTNLQTNLNDLFLKLTSEVYSSNTGFANANINIGQPNQFNGLIMCYIDSSQHDCLDCLNVSIKNATVLCPISSTATFTYEQCFLRYSKENFIAALSLDQYPYPYWNQNNVSNSSTFEETVSELLNSLRLEAIMSSNLLCAYGNQTDPGINQMVYGLVQCTRDLDTYLCGLCLQSIIGNLTSDLIETPYKGARYSSTSCYIRFELYPLPLLTFTSVAPMPESPPISPPPFNKAIGVITAPAQPPQIQKNGNGVSSKQLFKIVGVLVGAVAAALVLAAGGIWLWRRESIASTSKTDEEEATTPLEHQAYSSMLCYSEFKVFELDTLRLATNYFSDENKLGEGGFGSVYKGSLTDGQELAVKRLSGSSRQGLAELINEVDLLAKLKHRNLVQLVGCCIQQKEKILCYEFLPNGSLDNFLFDMTPKISDFGLARLFDEDQTHKDTSIIAGTFGYMAPEYVLHGSFSAKSDVYSFGVLLLEIAMGRKIRSFTNDVRACSLISYVSQHVAVGKIDQLKDPALDYACPEEVMKCIHVGLLCVQEDPIKRPNMEAIGVMLDSTYTTSIPALPSSPHTSSSYEL